MALANASSIYISAFLKALKPKERLTVSEWSDKYRKLSSKASAEPGQWRTSRTPYLKAIMDELSHMCTTQKIVVKKSAQVGFTEMGNNWIGYTIDHDPSTMMVVWPTLPDVKKNSKLRVDPLIESTPCLKEKVSTGKGKDSKNTALFKDFDGGALILTGANSASGLRSVPSKKLFLDEIDGYPEDVEGEGDPVALCMVRSRTFSKKKALLGSTPTYAGRSKIDNEFRMSDQRYFYMPCPKCDEFQLLHHVLDEDPLDIFDNLIYETESTPNGKIVTYASYFCKHCGEEIKEHNKTKMMARGEWRKHNEKSIVAGFFLGAVFSPLGWYSWKQLCQDYEDAKATGNDDKMKTFINTALGEVYEDKGEKPAHENLYSRREFYKIGSVPEGVLFLTCAVDIQKNRLEAEVHGFGRDRERWVIDRAILMGDPEKSEVWDDLENYITGTFRHDKGHEMSLRMVVIDSGYLSSQAYSFVRRFNPNRVRAIKGVDVQNKMIAVPTAVDVKTSGKTIRRGVQLWKIATHMIKSEVYGDLKKDAPNEELDGFPPGYVHFPQMDFEYFLQLTAEEKKIVKDKKGFNKIEWHKKRERNETLDLFVYNRAAAAMVGIDRFKESNWLKMEKNLAVHNPLQKQEPKKALSKKDRRRSKGSGFWK